MSDGHCCDPKEGFCVSAWYDWSGYFCTSLPVMRVCWVKRGRERGRQGNKGGTGRGKGEREGGRVERNELCLVHACCLAFHV